MHLRVRHVGADRRGFVFARRHHAVHLREDAGLDLLQALALGERVRVALQFPAAAFAQVVQVVRVIQDRRPGFRPDQAEDGAGHVGPGGPNKVKLPAIRPQPAVQRFRRVQHLDAVLLQGGGVGLGGRGVEGRAEDDLVAHVL